MDFLIGYVKDLIAKEPARVAAYGGSIALAGALALAKAVGVELSPEITTGVQAAGVLIVTELIRRLVFAPATVDKIVAATTEPQHVMGADLPVAE